MDEPSRATRRVPPPSGPTVVEADICVVGSGAAGLSAALEAARLGRRTVLVEAGPTLGGQAVNSIIGTFCGLYSNGPEPFQVTYGIATDIIRDLTAAGAIHRRYGRNTIVLLYNVTALARWMENAVAGSDVVPILGAALTGVARDGRRVRSIDLATRYGAVTVRAGGFVDASGDAALSWHAGLAVQEPEAEVFGTQMFVLEHVDEDALSRLAPSDIETRLAAKGDAYDLMRRDGFAFAFPGSGTALVNMTHLHTPPEALAMSRATLEGRAEADRVLSFLSTEFPEPFGRAQVRSYGQPGVRQSRWIEGRTRLTVEDVRAETRFEDAVARCSWPIELHQKAEGVYWEQFGDGHMHYVPFGTMTPADADNVVAAGRCIDADAVALSSVRVMGPCIAMGAAAAHALDLAGAGSVHQIDIGALQDRVRDNLARND